MNDRHNKKLFLICLCGLFFTGITLSARSQTDSPRNISEQSIKRPENEVFKTSDRSDRLTHDTYFKNKEVETKKLRIVSYFHEGLAQFEQNGKYGYVDEQGNIAVAAKYDEAGNFSEQLAAVVLDGKSFFIDGAGRVVIALENYDAYSNHREQHMAFGGNLPFIDYLYTLSEFKNGVAEVSKPKLPKDYKYKTQEEANGAKEFLCNTIDRTGKILGEDKPCKIESIY